MATVSSISSWASLLSTLTAIASYLALASPAVGQSPIAWALFGVHLLTAGVGAVASMVAALTHSPWWLVSLAACGYILLLQFTTLVPAPFDLILR